jgi:hypothetical protein
MMGVYGAEKSGRIVSREREKEKCTSTILSVRFPRFARRKFGK